MLEFSNVDGLVESSVRETKLWEMIMDERRKYWKEGNYDNNGTP
jgi:hypothetical protein